MARMTAPATMPKPMYLPSARRLSLILASEEHEPRGEDPQRAEARVHECCGTELRGDLRRDEQLPGEYGEHDSHDDADQPCRKERAQDVDRRREAAACRRKEDGEGDTPARPHHGAATE